MPDQADKLVLEAVGANPGAECSHVAAVKVDQKLADKAQRTRQTSILQGCTKVADFWMTAWEHGWAERSAQTDVVERATPYLVDGG